MAFSFSSDFMLDKAHFQECYDQTAVIKRGLIAYRKSIILFVLGMLASAIAQQHKALALFVVVLSAVDAASVYFAKPWWVWRQLLSRAANTNVHLVIDNKGIATNSVNHKLEVTWQEINQITSTSAGIIIHHQQGRSYLSKLYLSAEAIDYILKKVH